MSHNENYKNREFLYFIQRKPQHFYIPCRQEETFKVYPDM